MRILPIVIVALSACCWLLGACGESTTTPLDGGADLGALDLGARDLGAPDLGDDAGITSDLGTGDGGADLGADAGCVDADGDRHGAMSCGGDDCDDTVISIHPGASEVCNGADDDCDGSIDEGVASTYYRDADGDGYGDATMLTACAVPAGYALSPGDCNDTVAAVHPGATDTCDGIDNDCDGTVDASCTCSSGSMRVCGAGDGSGGVLTVGACDAGAQVCTAGVWGACVGSIGPVPETCNGVDDDCDGTTDPACP